MCLIMLFLAIGLATSAVAEEPPLFQWQRTVDIPPFTETSVVSVPFDSHVFSATRDGFPDLRLRRNDGVSIAFLVRQAPDTEEKQTIRSTWPAKQTGVKLLDDGGMQVMLDLAEKDPLPTGLRISTPLRDFEVQVRVESSPDGKMWTPAGSPVVIFDYSQHIDARHLEVPVATQSRHLRLMIEDVTAEQESQLLELTRRLRGSAETDRTERTTVQRRPFRIDRIDFFRDETTVQPTAAQTREYPAAEFAVSEAKDKQRTLVSFTTQREPITAIRILTDAANFSRTAMIEMGTEQPSGTQGWRSIGTGMLTRFAVGALSKDERTVTIPESRAERYRIVIENRDSPPLAITGVELSGPVYESVFLATPGETVRIEYGSPDAEPGHYDTAALWASLSAGTKPLPANLGPPRMETNAPTKPKWTPWNDPRVLIGGIVGLTIVLGWGLYTASRRIEPLKQFQSPQE